MDDDAKLLPLISRLHRQLSGKFGITGFGLSQGYINVYRAAEHPNAETAIRQIVEQDAPGTPIRMTPAGGDFKPY